VAPVSLAATWDPAEMYCGAFSTPSRTTLTLWKDRAAAGVCCYLSIRTAAEFPQAGGSLCMTGTLWKDRAAVGVCCYLSRRTTAELPQAVGSLARWAAYTLTRIFLVAYQTSQAADNSHGHLTGYLLMSPFVAIFRSRFRSWMVPANTKWYDGIVNWWLRRQYWLLTSQSAALRLLSTTGLHVSLLSVA